MALYGCVKAIRDSDVVFHTWDLFCSGVPFNGWYADSEIVRNMTDEGRFNMLPQVAQHLGYNLADNASLWRDAALQVVNEVCIWAHCWQTLQLLLCGSDVEVAWLSSSV